MVVSDVAVAEAPKVAALAKAACTKVKVSTKPASDGTVQQQALGKEFELRVPVMINLKAIKTDEELLVYRPAKRKVERSLASTAKVAKLMKDNTK